MFAHDTEVALRSVVALVNSVEVPPVSAPRDTARDPTPTADWPAPGAPHADDALPPHDELADPAALDRFLDVEGFTGRREGTTEVLASVHRLRATLASVWDTSDEQAIVRIVNELLGDAQVRPQLTRHDAFDWHLHMTDPDAPLVDRMGTEAAMALVDLIRVGETRRLKRCEAENCAAAFVDLSRNRSRRYCDTGNCGNRQHVAAYRARRAAGG